MFRFIRNRILGAIAVLLTAMFAVFAILTYIPGSRLGYLGIQGSGDLLDRLFTFFRTEPNLFSRYVRYTYDVITRFHFASGFRHHNLSAEILTRTRLTLLLTLIGLVFIVVVGIFMGTLAASKRGTWLDRIISVVSMLTASIPPFCLAIYLAMIFCVGLRLLPVFGYSKPINFILPTITISASALANTIQICRFEIIEELNKPYVRNLRSRGQKENVILFRHALKNAMLPTIATIKEMTASIFVSTFIAEWFYAIPGIGYYLIQAINSRDYGIILACTMVIAIVIIVFNIVSDILYCIFDPKLRRSEMGAGNNV
ncbi:MAG: ABC transporter permease [Erysipelotrichaceae bacterium]|nr:ABC transporter permease [Erysipelotrichaceae bacterium]